MEQALNAEMLACDPATGVPSLESFMARAQEALRKVPAAGCAFMVVGFGLPAAAGYPALKGLPFYPVERGRRVRLLRRA